MPKKENSKKAKSKKEPSRENVLEEMNKLPSLDLLRICLTGLAVLHERAVISLKDEESNISDDDVVAEAPTLLVP